MIHARILLSLLTTNSLLRYKQAETSEHFDSDKLFEMLKIPQSCILMAE